MLDKTRQLPYRTDISKEHLKVLLEVRRDLESGKITEEQFDMSTAREPHTCGTVGCIGGWMSVYMEMSRWDGYQFVINMPYENPLRRLFYDYPDGVDVTPAEGAAAITKFLEGSNDPWEG